LKGTTDPRPTIAGKRIYDSRISAEEADVFTEEAEPIVIVLTDGDEGDALSDQNGGPPFHRKIDLVFDIGMVCREKADTDADGYLIGYPDTDARLEASIDTLQTQIIRYLSQSGDPLAIFFQRFVRVWKQSSHRQVEDTAAVKLARRLWTLECELNDDVYELFPVGGTPTGLDALPEPLRTVALMMPAGSSGAEIAAAIASALGVTPFTATALNGVDITTDANPSANPQVVSDQIVSKADAGQ
jgi:hypothetical protein